MTDRSEMTEMNVLKWNPSMALLAFSHNFYQISQYSVLSIYTLYWKVVPKKKLLDSWDVRFQKLQQNAGVRVSKDMLGSV